MSTKRDYRLQYIDMYPQPVSEPNTVKSFLLSTRLKVYAAAMFFSPLYLGLNLSRIIAVAIIGAFILWCMQPKS